VKGDLSQVVKNRKKIFEVIEKLGNEIVQCKAKCKGIENNQRDGYYPRIFFLDPENASEIEVLVVGENPGNSAFLEREFYKVLSERNRAKVAMFKDCRRVWRTIVKEHDYYLRPKHLLKQLGLNPKGTLFAEVVFCEKSHSTGRIPNKTFEKCCNRFLRKIVKLVPEKKYILCLGTNAFVYTRNMPESAHKKLIAAYHPTGSRIFANYFEKEKGKKIIGRRLKRKILTDFRALEASNKPYMCKIRSKAVTSLYPSKQKEN